MAQGLRVTELWPREEMPPASVSREVPGPREAQVEPLFLTGHQPVLLVGHTCACQVLEGPEHSTDRKYGHKIRVNEGLTIVHPDF